MSSFEVEFQDCTHVCIQWSLDNKVSDLSQSPSKESEQLDWTVKPLKTSSLEMFTLTTKTGAGTVSVCWERDLKTRENIHTRMACCARQLFLNHQPGYSSLPSFRPIKPHRRVMGYFLHFSRCSLICNILESIFFRSNPVGLSGSWFFGIRLAFSWFIFYLSSFKKAYESH